MTKKENDERKFPWWILLLVGIMFLTYIVIALWKFVLTLLIGVIIGIVFKDKIMGIFKSKKKEDKHK